MSRTHDIELDHTTVRFITLDPADVTLDDPAGTVAQCHVPRAGVRSTLSRHLVAARFDHHISGLPQRASVLLEYLPPQPKTQHPDRMQLDRMRVDQTQRDSLRIRIPEVVSQAAVEGINPADFSAAPAHDEYLSAIIAGLLEPLTPAGEVIVHAVWHDEVRSSWVAFRVLTAMCGIWLHHGGQPTDHCRAHLSRVLL